MIDETLTNLRTRRIHVLVEQIEKDCKIYDEEFKFALIRGAIRSDWIFDVLSRYPSASTAEKPELLEGLFRLVKLLEMS